uniref:Uncharacterized protein n=1 Tax=Tetradesmus obliquus TaxID=3088 RepID=A0A383V548_TETOB|eukprot:jgi/Sobl393_1/12353/SZX59912.1
MLLTTQKNMLALNNSRVKVQEELAVANRRIADLEREVERLRLETTAAQQAAAEAQRAPPHVFSAPRSASPAPPAQYMQQQMPQQPQQMPYQQQQQPQQQQQQMPQQAPPQQQMQMQQQQQHPPQQMQQQPPQQMQQPPQQMQPPPPPAPPAVINLTYISGWHNCFIHYTMDGKTWTAVPGKKLTTSQQDHATKTISIEGTSMEFVMNNGENDWDSPGRYTDKPKNYQITEPGNYKLKRVELLPAGPAAAAVVRDSAMKTALASAAVSAEQDWILPGRYTDKRSYKLKSGKVERPGSHDEGAARDRACFVPGVSRSFGGKHLAV